MVCGNVYETMITAFMYTPTITLLDKNNPKDINALFTKKNQVTGRIFLTTLYFWTPPPPLQHSLAHMQRSTESFICKAKQLTHKKTSILLRLTQSLALLYTPVYSLMVGWLLIKLLRLYQDINLGISFGIMR